MCRDKIFSLAWLTSIKPSWKAFPQSWVSLRFIFGYYIGERPMYNAATGRDGVTVADVSELVHHN